MTFKYTYEQIEEYVNNIGYILINKEYINNRSKLVLTDKDGYYYFTFFNDLKFDHRPDKFNPKNPYTIQNIKLWLKLNNKNFELISDNYIRNNEYLTWKCLKENCKEEFQMTLGNVLSNNNCPYCHGLKVGLSNCLATKNPELASEWHSTLNGDLTPYDIICGSGKKVWWQCSKNPEHYWETKIRYRIYDNSGCPFCSESHGEKRVRRHLEENNILFKPQKMFDGLLGIGNGNLSYDFYLLEYNLLIEYQGEFHNGKVINQTKEQFEKQQEHDRRKKQYAIDNNIKLLEIWYWDFDNIEEILQDALLKNKPSFLFRKER